MTNRGVVVGMADMKVVKSPNNITTIGLGSCVGITMYDNVSKVGGLLHAMLPSIDEIADKTNRHKFSDSGVEDMYDEMLKNGARKSFIVAKIAGGAEMFRFVSDKSKESIGKRNYEAGIKKLRSLGIRVVAEDCGDSYGRTITLDIETGSVHVKSVGKPDKII